MSQDTDRPRPPVPSTPSRAERPDRPDRAGGAGGYAGRGGRPSRPGGDEAKPWENRDRSRKRSGAFVAPDEGKVYLYGLHTVEAAFLNKRRKRLSLMVTRNALARLEERGIKVDCPIEMVEPRQIDHRVGGDAVHQGVLLTARALDPLDLEDLGDARLVLALDQVTDPHNVGAILRSAVALGADGLITTTRHSPQENGVLAKAASGAVDLLPHAEVNNLSKALDALKRQGFTCVALDSAGVGRLEDVVVADRVALVLGAEGKGVRPGVRATCDAVARLDMPGVITSLNVSNAAVLAMYVLRNKLTR